MINYKRVFTGSMCNNDCLCCRFTGQSRENRFLSEIKEDLKNRGDVDSLEITGGETAIRTDFMDIINSARQQNYARIKLQTNGRAFSDWELARAAVEYGVHLFEIKLYAYSANIHDPITQQDGSLNETIQGIANLKSFKIPVGDNSKEPFVSIRIPICKENYEYIEDTVRFLVPLRIDRIILSFVDCQLPVSDIISHVSNAIDTAIFSRIWIQTERIPLCLMPEYEHHVVETFQSHKEHVSKQTKDCKKCIYVKSCPGIAADYLDKNGPSEFKSVSSSDHAVDLEELKQICINQPTSGKGA